MPLGESTREMFLNIGMQEAFAICHKAGQQCGSVQDANAGANSLVIKTRYGLQSVKLRVSLRPQAGGTLLSIQGASDDVWGGGARKGADKFVSALEPFVAAAASSAPPPTATDGVPPPLQEKQSAEARLEALKHLKDRGLISDAEFAEKRQQIIRDL